MPTLYESVASNILSVTPAAINAMTVSDTLVLTQSGSGITILNCLDTLK